MHRLRATARWIGRFPVTLAAIASVLPLVVGLFLPDGGIRDLVAIVSRIAIIPVYLSLLLTSIIARAVSAVLPTAVSGAIAFCVALLPFIGLDLAIHRLRRPQ